SMVRSAEWFGLRVARPMGEGYGLRIMPNILKAVHHLFQPFTRQKMGSLIHPPGLKPAPASSQTEINHFLY
ncbi:MAG: hypothetical protein U0938_08895, partial [Thiobacillus sp.]|nr:hypothetical protein [Thiobacillus sp.]